LGLVRGRLIFQPAEAWKSNVRGKRPCSLKQSEPGPPPPQFRLQLFYPGSQGKLDFLLRAGCSENGQLGHAGGSHGLIRQNPVDWNRRATFRRALSVERTATAASAGHLNLAAGYRLSADQTLPFVVKRSPFTKSIKPPENIQLIFRRKSDRRFDECSM